MTSGSLDGRVALVTGAASGIGYGIAAALAQAGARVAINDIAPDAATTAAARLGGNAFPAAGDVSDEGSAETVVTQVVAQAGMIDILVNNAGVPQPLVRLTDLELTDWQKVIDVNLRGNFLMSRAAGRVMIGQKRGAIVNVASVAGLTAFPGSHAYGVAKAGVAMMTQTLATELGVRGIRVNAVVPGVIEAPMLGAIATTDNARATIIERVPLGRLGTPAEIGQAVAFLASDAASYINGILLPVDGGWLAYGGAGPAFRRRPAPREIGEEA